MANTLTDVAPVLLAQGLMALRNNNVMAALVNNDYDAAFADHGDTVNVPVPTSITVGDVTPAETPPAGPNLVPTKVPIVLNQWKDADFYMSDKDIQQAFDGVIPMQASEAVAALADTINAYIFGLYPKIYGYTGVAGTTPFASTTTEATATRSILTKQKCPLGNRKFVIDPDAEAKALDLRAFQDASFSGSPNVIQEGQITRKLGFDWVTDQQVPTHTAGTITTGLIAKASTAQAIGLKAVVCTTAATTGACALLVGDVVVFAGDTQTYVLTAVATQASASTDVTLNVEPGLKIALAGSEAVTVKGNHVVNLAFHRDAFAFASRPLADITDGLGNIIEAMIDPVSGVAMRLEISREHKRTKFSYDILYGASTVRPELASRLAG